MHLLRNLRLFLSEYMSFIRFLHPVCHKLRTCDMEARGGASRWGCWTSEKSKYLWYWFITFPFYWGEKDLSNLRKIPKSLGKSGNHIIRKQCYEQLVTSFTPNCIWKKKQLCIISMQWRLPAWAGAVSQSAASLHDVFPAVTHLNDLLINRWADACMWKHRNTHILQLRSAAVFWEAHFPSGQSTLLNVSQACRRMLILKDISSNFNTPSSWKWHVKDKLQAVWPANLKSARSVWLIPLAPEFCVCT